MHTTRVSRMHNIFPTLQWQITIECIRPFGPFGPFEITLPVVDSSELAKKRCFEKWYLHCFAKLPHTLEYPGCITLFRLYSGRSLQNVYVRLDHSDHSFLLLLLSTALSLRRRDALKNGTFKAPIECILLEYLGCITFFRLYSGRSLQNVYVLLDHSDHSKLHFLLSTALSLRRRDALKNGTFMSPLECMLSMMHTTMEVPITFMYSRTQVHENTNV